MRLKCNKCNEWKNVKKETYERMLKRYGIARSIMMGITQPHLILSQERLQQKLSDIEIEKSFLKWYQCKKCRNAKNKITQETKKLLNNFKQINNYDDYDDYEIK